MTTNLDDNNSEYYLYYYYTNYNSYWNCYSNFSIFWVLVYGDEEEVEGSKLYQKLR